MVLIFVLLFSALGPPLIIGLLGSMGLSPAPSFNWALQIAQLHPAPDGSTPG